ncbi:MAG: hypothetical protein ACYC00_19115 [Eubacteriales bacterium]
MRKTYNQEESNEALNLAEKIRVTLTGQRLEINPIPYLTGGAEWQKKRKNELPNLIFAKKNGVQKTNV